LFGHKTSRGAEHSETQCRLIGQSSKGEAINWFALVRRTMWRCQQSSCGAGGKPGN